MTKALDKSRIRREILRLMLPTVAENILQMLAGLVITAMVGRLMAGDISAQGISNRLFHIAFALFRGLGMGATVVVALYFGAGERTRCRRVVEQAFLSITPIAILVSTLIILFAPVLLGFFSKDAALLATAVAYTKVTVWAIPFIAVGALNTAAFHGHGDTRTPMIIAIGLNLVNIGVGYVAIFGIGGIGGWGIRGAAIATVCAHCVSCLAGLVMLYRPKGLLRQISHGLPFFKIDLATVREVFATGVPAAMENLFWQLSAVVMSKVILGYSENHYAAYLLGLQAEMLTEMPAAGFVTASTTLSARAIGRRDSRLFRDYHKTTMQLASILAIAASAALFIFPNAIMSLLTNKPDLQQIGASYVFLMGFAQIPQVLSKVYTGIIRASGGKRIPMYISFLGIWGIRVPLVILVGWALHADIRIIWAIIAIDQTARMVMDMIYMKRKDVIHTVDRINRQEEMLRAPQEGVS